MFGFTSSMCYVYHAKFYRGLRQINSMYFVRYNNLMLDKNDAAHQDCIVFSFVSLSN